MACFKDLTASFWFELGFSPGLTGVWEAVKITRSLWERKLFPRNIPLCSVPTNLRVHHTALSLRDEQGMEEPAGTSGNLECSWD